MKDKDYSDFIGGIDSRDSYIPEKEAYFFEDCLNVDKVGKNWIKTRGCQAVITMTDEYSKGQAEYDYIGTKFLVYLTNLGNVYSWDDITNEPMLKISSLTPESSPYFFQYYNKFFILTGLDDGYILDYASTPQYSQCGLLAARGAYGKFGESFAGRAFIASGRTLYYSALGLPSDWLTANDAGLFTNFHSDITGLKKYGEYLIIYTKTGPWILSGDNPSNFIITEGSAAPIILSKFGMCNFNTFHFAYSDGIVPVQLNSLGQISGGEPVSFRINDNLTEEIDIDRLSEIIMIPYEDRNQIWMYVPQKGVEGLKRCWIIDFNHFFDKKKIIAFFPREGKTITTACKYKNSIYSADSSGKIYKENSGTTFDGEEINWNIKLPKMDFGNRSRMKSCQFIRLWVSKLTINNFDVTEISMDGEEDTETIAVEDETIPLYDEDNWDEAYVLSAGYIYEDIFAMDTPAYQFKFSGSNGQDIIFSGISFLYLRLLNSV